MALTTKIKVINVQAGDPHLSFTLTSDDGGIFPDQVRVAAVMNNPDFANTYYGNSTQPGGAVLSINFTIQFSDPNYANETILYYTLTIYFPDGRGGWVPYSDWVDCGTGTVVASHDGGGQDVVEVAEEAPAETTGSTAGSKNKGCLAFLGMLPF